MVTEDGHSEVKVRRQIQAGANAWKKVEGVMLDRKISKKLKGKVLRMCVTPACLSDLETVALTEQQKLQVYENWVRRITRTKRDDLRKEVGMQCNLTGTLVRWADHLVRMDAGKLAESRGGKTSRTQEKGKATAEMGGLHEEGYEKIGGR